MVDRKETVRDWDVPPRPRRTARVALLMLPTPVVVVVLLWLVAGPLVAAAAALVGVVLVLFAWMTQGARLLRRLEARPAELARLRNLAAGLARDLGRPVPALFVAPGAPNAFVLPRGDEGGVVVTETLLQGVTRTELEAVVAFCLARLDDGSFGLARWSDIAPPVLRVLAPVTDLDVDARAAALTRYPPALAAAIEKAEPRGDRAAAFAFVAAEPWQRPPEQRAAALREL